MLGLELGADDYIPKPFAPRRTGRAVRALLRRAQAKRRSATRDWLRTASLFAGWALDTRRRELTAPDGVAVDLSGGEYDLLLAFCEHPQRVLQPRSAARRRPQPGLGRASTAPWMCRSAGCAGRSSRRRRARPSSRPSAAPATCSSLRSPRVSGTPPGRFRLRLLPDTLGGRIVLVLLVGLMTFHWAASGCTRSAPTRCSDLRVSARLPSASPRRSAPWPSCPSPNATGQRMRSPPPASTCTGPRANRQPVEATSPRIEALRSRLVELVPEFGAPACGWAMGRTASAWLVARQSVSDHRRGRAAGWHLAQFLRRLFRPPASEHATLLSTSAMAVGILLLGLLVVRLIGRPLRRCLMPRIASAARPGGAHARGGPLRGAPRGAGLQPHADPASNKLIADRPRPLRPSAMICARPSRGCGCAQASSRMVRRSAPSMPTSTRWTR